MHRLPKQSVVFARVAASVTLTMVMISGVMISGLAAQEKKPPKITFDEHVQPILRQKCYSCHNPDKKNGDLDVTNYTNLMLGGGSGAVVEPGDASASYLYLLVSHQEEPYMPPESPKIADAMVETLRKWIDGGALENAGSKALVRKKPMFDLALKTAPTERPAVAPSPARLSLEPVLHTEKPTTVVSMASNPWAPLVAVAGQQQVLLFHSQSLDLLGRYPYPEGTPHILKFSRNGDLLLAGGGRDGASGKVVVWNIKTGERVIEVGDELDAVLAADISADQTLVALGGPQRVVRIYSTESGKLLHELRKHTDWIYSVEFSPDGVLLATGDRTGGLMVWEGWTGREYLTLKAHTKGVTDVSWRSDSNVLASCSEDGSVRLWEMNNGGQVKSWTAHGGGAQSLEFTRDGRLISCGRDRVTKLWKQDGGQIRAFEAFSDIAVSATFCDESDRAFSADWTGEIRVWDAKDGKRLGNLSSNPLPLAGQLAAAKQSVVQSQAAYQPLLVAYQTAEQTATKVKTDLAAAQKALAASQTQMAAAEAKRKVSAQAVQKATQAHDAAKTAAAALEPVVPLLQEALAKAKAAMAKATADKELAGLTAQLTAFTQKRSAELAASRKTMAEQAKAVETAKAQMAAAEKESAAAKVAMAAAKKMVDTLTPLVKPAVDKQAAAKTASDASAQTLAAAQQTVGRWEQEIVFAGKIKQLIEQRAAAREKLLAEQTQHQELATASSEAAMAMQKTATDLVTAQTAVAATQKQVEAGAAKAAASRKAVTDATARHQAVGKTITALEEAIAPLGQASKTTADVAAKLAGDKPLAEAAAKLKAVLAQKQTELAAAKGMLTEKAKAMEAAKPLMVAADKQLADSNAALKATQTRVAQMTAAMTTAKEKATTTQQAAVAKAQAVANAQKQLDEVQGQITTARGIGQAKAS